MTTTGGDSLHESRELESLNRNVAEWEQRRDAEAKQELDACLSADLVFRRADGTVVGKPAFMRGLEGESPFSRRESRDVTVMVMGARALVTLTVLATSKGDGTTSRYRNVRVFFRREGRWLLEVWFNDDTTDLERA